MKKILLVVLMLVVLSMAASARESILLKDNAGKLELVRVDPSPLKPGSPAEVSFELTNVESTSLDDVRLSLVSVFPFSFADGETGTVSFRSIAPGDKISFKFRLKVNENAQEESYPLRVQYYSARMGAYSSYEYTLSVVKTSDIVSIDSISVEPSKVPPGGTAKITVKVTNSFRYVMKDITLSLGLQSGTIPFAPLDSTAERRVSELGIGESADVDFRIIALPSTQADIYKVPLNIKYYDDLGNLYNKSEIFGIVVWDKPEVKLLVKENSIVLPNKVGDIVLSIVNTGLIDTKLMTVMLHHSEDYEILSSNPVYVGSLESDDDETADFKIHLKSGKNPIMLPVTLEFRDANNDKYSQEENLELKLYKESELNNSNGTLTWIIVVLILAVAGYFGYRRWKKKR